MLCAYARSDHDKVETTTRSNVSLFRRLTVRLFLWWYEGLHLGEKELDRIFLAPLTRNDRRSRENDNMNFSVCIVWLLFVFRDNGGRRCLMSSRDAIAAKRDILRKPALIWRKKGFDQMYTRVKEKAYYPIAKFVLWKRRGRRCEIPRTCSKSGYFYLSYSFIKITSFNSFNTIPFQINLFGNFFSY